MKNRLEGKKGLHILNYCRHGSTSSLAESIKDIKKWIIHNLALENGHTQLCQRLRGLSTSIISKLGMTEVSNNLGNMTVAMKVGT